MPKAADHRSSAVEFDGAIPFVVNSPEMSLSTAASDQGKFVAPCDGTIVKCTVNLVEAPGTASATMSIGIGTDTDYFTSTTDLTFATGDATGVRDMTGDLSNLDVNEGDVIEFNTAGEATTTGLVAATLVISPNAA